MGKRKLKDQVALSIYVPRELADRLAQIAREEDRSLNRTIRRLVTEALRARQDQTDAAQN